MNFATNGGMFALSTYQPYIQEQKRGVDCLIYFHVTASIGTAKIGLIQACHAVYMKENAWTNYLTSEAKDEVLSDDGWFIDAGGSKNPVFGMRINNNIPFSQANKIENGTSHFGTVQERASKYGTNQPTTLDPAFLEDRPTRSVMGIPIRHEFESVALCLEGSWAGTCLGSIRWGYTVEADNQLKLIKVTATDNNSEQWKGAALAWNKTGNIKIPFK